MLMQTPEASQSSSEGEEQGEREREPEPEPERETGVWGLNATGSCGKGPHFNCQPLHFFSRNSALLSCDSGITGRLIPTSLRRLAHFGDPTS